MQRPQKSINIPQWQVQAPADAFSNESSDFNIRALTDGGRRRLLAKGERKPEAESGDVGATTRALISSDVRT